MHNLAMTGVSKGIFVHVLAYACLYASVNFCAYARSSFCVYVHF